MKELVKCIKNIDLNNVERLQQKHAKKVCLYFCKLCYTQFDF